MLKLSISLPNSTQITLESDEFDVVNRVLTMLLHSGMQGVSQVPVPAADATNGHAGAVEKSTDAVTQPPSPPAYPPETEPSQSANKAATQFVPQRPPSSHAPGAAYTPPMMPANESDEDGLFLEAYSPEARDDFVAFCQNVNPMGDMRRVVVAADAAGRFFTADGVNADELGELFDLVGWRRANSFTQTLRNAARSKFGWLERIPGRSGRYAATDLGRSVTMSA
jgi:hypothetical protein